MQAQNNLLESLNRSINNLFFSQDSKWYHVNDGCDSLFCLEYRQEMYQLIELYKLFLSQRYGRSAEFNNAMIIIRNPEINQPLNFNYKKVFTQSRPQNQQPTSQDPFGNWQTATPNEGIFRQRLKKPEPQSIPTNYSNSTSSQANLVNIMFLRVNLTFSSMKYNEDISPIRPIKAAWLPAYCHFSYLDPLLSQHLIKFGGGLSIDNVTAVVKAGNALNLPLQN